MCNDQPSAPWKIAMVFLPIAHAHECCLFVHFLYFLLFGLLELGLLGRPEMLRKIALSKVVICRFENEALEVVIT